MVKTAPTAHSSAHQGQQMKQDWALNLQPPASSSWALLQKATSQNSDTSRGPRVQTQEPVGAFYVQTITVKKSSKFNC